MMNDFGVLIRKLHEQAAKHRLTLVQVRGSSHIKVYQDGKQVSSLPWKSNSPSGYRNQRARLRRLGLDV
jgi:hypothetical protein